MRRMNAPHSAEYAIEPLFRPTRALHRNIVMPFFVSAKTIREYWWLKRFKFCLENPDVVISKELWAGNYWISYKQSNKLYYEFFETEHDWTDKLNSCRSQCIEFEASGVEFSTLVKSDFWMDYVVRYRKAIETQNYESSIFKSTFYIDGR